MKWRRWLNFKNHWYLEPEDGIRMEVDGEHYKITVHGEIVAQDNAHSQQYAMDVCSAWYHRTKLNELKLSGTEVCSG